MNNYFVEMIVRDGEYAISHRSIRQANNEQEAGVLAKAGQSYGRHDYREFEIYRTILLTDEEYEVLKRFL